MSDRYDTAKICVNGHIITDSIEVDPRTDQKFCEKCGKDLLTKCLNCGANIPGRRYIKDATRLGTKYRTVGLYNPPAFCKNCRKPYPWTENKIQAARELVTKNQDISDDDKNSLTKGIDDIIDDTPTAKVSEDKFKNILSKYGKSVSVALRDILIDVVSETARRIIWPK